MNIKLSCLLIACFSLSSSVAVAQSVTPPGTPRGDINSPFPEAPAIHPPAPYEPGDQVRDDHSANVPVIMALRQHFLHQQNLPVGYRLYLGAQATPHYPIVFPHQGLFEVFDVVDEVPQPLAEALAAIQYLINNTFLDDHTDGARAEFIKILSAILRGQNLTIERIVHDEAVGNYTIGNTQVRVSFLPNVTHQNLLLALIQLEPNRGVPPLPMRAPQVPPPPPAPAQPAAVTQRVGPNPFLGGEQHPWMTEIGDLLDIEEIDVDNLQPMIADVIAENGLAVTPDGARIMIGTIYVNPASPLHSILKSQKSPKSPAARRSPASSSSSSSSSSSATSTPTSTLTPTPTALVGSHAEHAKKLREEREARVRQETAAVVQRPNWLTPRNLATVLIPVIAVAWYLNLFHFLGWR